METCAEHIGLHLSKCRHILNKGYSNMHITKITWLNSFCLEFLKLSEKLHKFIGLGNDRSSIECQGQIETVYLCLTQIVTCIKYMENTIKLEEKLNKAVSSSRQHFLDRILWCLDRLSTCVKSIKSRESLRCDPVEESTFVDLMDTVLDQLSPYSSYKDEWSTPPSKVTNVAEDQAQSMFVSKQIRSIVDLVLSHTLAFANVALQKDKKALSALCQKVLRECMAFQDECSLAAGSGSESNRRLKAISLENALYHLEDYINEALLRLVYTSFLDYKKLSIEMLRKVIKSKDVEDLELDELIADFDVNIDRTTQIGIFAIAFASNVRIKTTVRSCLASFESLDSCIIPSVQSKATCETYAHLLEQHFNEEISKFKQAIQEIIDSQAFASCYQEILNQSIISNDREYNKESLYDIIEMGNILVEHFHIEVNRKELNKEPKRLEYFNKFILMLKECLAILKFSEKENIDSLRIMKRFKILRSVLRNFINEIGVKKNGSQECIEFIMSDEVNDSNLMFESIGISPSIQSILYDNSPATEARKRLLRPMRTDSLKGNCSKFPIISPISNKSNIEKIKMNTNSSSKIAVPQTRPPSTVRRKQSLRTAMFKRQKLCDTQEVIFQDSGSLQISEILDQLSGLSSDFSEFIFDKSIISQ